MVNINTIHFIIHGIGTLSLILAYYRKTIIPRIKPFFKFALSLITKNKQTDMKILSFLIPFITNFLTMFTGKINVSNSAAQFLKDLQSISDNVQAIVDGTYTFTSTGNATFDAVEQVIIGFIKDYLATNPELVTTELKNLTDEIVPIINDFISKTNAVPPPEAEVNKPTFLQSALLFIEDILGLPNKNGSPEVVQAQTAAVGAKAQILQHIEANIATAAKKASK